MLCWGMPALFRTTPAPPAASRAGELPARNSGALRYYRPELDALRFGAFLLVFLHHAFPRDPMSYAAALGPELAVVWASVVNAWGC